MQPFIAHPLILQNKTLQTQINMDIMYRDSAQQLIPIQCCPETKSLESQTLDDITEGLYQALISKQRKLSGHQQLLFKEKYLQPILKLEKLYQEAKSSLFFSESKKRAIRIEAQRLLNSSRSSRYLKSPLKLYEAEMGDRCSFEHITRDEIKAKLLLTPGYGLLSFDQLLNIVSSVI